MNILIGVTGGIAAYKAADLANGLTACGHSVRFIMTDKAKEFITPLTLASLSEGVIDDNAEWTATPDIHHISLAEWANVFVIYPATANTIAKIANGIADNLLTSTWLAFPKLKIVCPAMNTGMWNNKVTRKNMETLTSSHVKILGPISGRLACGDTGIGKLLKPRQAVIGINQAINTYQIKTKPKTIIVTSGGTRSPLDGMRVITNKSSGQLGAVAIDYILSNTNHKVIHLAPRVSMSPTLATAFPDRYQFFRTETVDDVYKELHAQVFNADAIIHAMAISDFTFDVDETVKLDSNNIEGFVELIKNSCKKAPKIIAEIKQWNPDIKLIGFKFTNNKSLKEIEEICEKQINSCGSDIVISNDLAEMKRTGQHIARAYDNHDSAYKIVLKGKNEIVQYIVDYIG